MHPGDDVLTLEREAAAQRGRVPGSLRLRDERGGPVGLEAKHPDRLCFQDPRHLVGDRSEDLNRRRFACRQRRHTPQRCLLLGQPRLRAHARLGDSQIAVAISSVNWPRAPLQPSAASPAFDGMYRFSNGRHTRRPSSDVPERIERAACRSSGWTNVGERPSPSSSSDGVAELLALEARH